MTAWCSASLCLFCSFQAGPWCRSRWGGGQGAVEGAPGRVAAGGQSWMSNVALVFFYLFFCPKALLRQRRRGGVHKKMPKSFLAAVLLSPSVERFFVISRMRDFLYLINIKFNQDLHNCNATADRAVDFGQGISMGSEALTTSRRFKSPWNQ